MTADEASSELNDVGESLLLLGDPAGRALRADGSLVHASGDDWTFEFEPGSTADVFSGTLTVTEIVLGQRQTIDGEEWDAFDGQVEHSTTWVQPSESQRAHSRHESLGLLKVTTQSGRWFNIHRLVVGTSGNSLCHRAEVEGSDGVRIDDDFEGCPPL